MSHSLIRSILDSTIFRQAIEIPARAEWPEDVVVMNAEQPAAIGTILVEHVHKHLANASIGYLFRKTMGDRMAKPSKTSGPLRFFSQLDFLVQVNWTVWATLKPPQKLALIDQQLCHFARGDEDDGDAAFIMMTYDIEEFNAIVQRHGAWRPAVAAFQKSFSQYDLFEQQALQPTAE